MKNKILTLIFLFASLFVQAQRTNQAFWSYIDKYKGWAIEQMNQYGIPASITLAQGLLESNAGRSTLATQANNHFGIKCHSWDGERTYHDDDEAGECFRVYKNVRDSYEDHSMFLATGSRYAFLFKFDHTDYVNWAKGLKRAGYATSPTYAEKLIGIIESYGLDRYDRAGYGEVKETAVRYAGSHEPMLAHDLVYIVTRQGDTMQGIADEFGIPRRKLMRYNDQHKYYVPAKGDILYLHRKYRRARKPNMHHVVAEGESMYLIAQMYGIRLSSLYRLNEAEPATFAPMPGDIIRLR